MAKKGIDCKIYRNSSTYATPTWVVVDAILDAALNLTWDEGDASSRASAVKKSEPTLLGIEVTGRIKVSDTDTGFIAFDDAFAGGTAIDLMILNGPKDDNGVRGWRGEFKIFSFSEDQAAANILYRDFTLKPCDSAEDFSRAVVASGAPAFTEAAPVLS